MQNILRKPALVFLQLKVIFILGKILGHGDELVPDVVLPLPRLGGSGFRGTRSLILRFGPDSKDSFRQPLAE